MYINIKNNLRNLRLKIKLYFNRNKILSNGGGSLFCNNCVGAMVLHDFKMPFLTPTVNLYIPPSDYIEMLKHLEKYMASDFEDVSEDNICPVGLLGGKVRVYFLHYKSFEEGIKAWKRRAARVDYDKLRIVLVERDGCTQKDLRDFDELPYKHKVALTRLPHPEIKCSFHIKGFEKEKQLGMLMDFQGYTGSRYYDQFPWMRFLYGKYYN